MTSAVKLKMAGTATVACAAGFSKSTSIEAVVPSSFTGVPLPAGAPVPGSETLAVPSTWTSRWTLLAVWAESRPAWTIAFGSERVGLGEAVLPQATAITATVAMRVRRIRFMWQGSRAAREAVNRAATRRSSPDRPQRRLHVEPSSRGRIAPGRDEGLPVARIGWEPEHGVEAP